MSNHAQQKTSLISLGIPDIQCLWDRKTTVFGKHILDYTGSSVPENKGAPFEATMCNGMLNLVDTPATPKVRCENCSLTIPINGKSQSHSEWENIIYEWMRIVFSFSLIFSMRTRLGLKLNSLESVCWHESGVRSLKSFTPELDEVDPEAGLTVETRVNGELRQHGSTLNFIFSIPELLTYISAAITLEPGDLILTGTPAGVGPLKPGDQVEVSVAGLGMLSHSVESDPN